MTAARLALVVVALAVLPAPAAAAAPKGFFGLQAWATPSAGEFAVMGEAGVGTFRANLYWSKVEPRPGERNWDSFDPLVADAARAGLTVLPVLYSTPGFAGGGLGPPRSSSAKLAFATFTREAVERYRPGGAFWQAHPELPQVPVRAWQVWNEPNFPAYWSGRPNPRQYASLVKLLSVEIRRADPEAKVVLAGLPESRRGIPAPEFLDSVYRVPGIKSHFDAAAIHPYARGESGVLDGIGRARRVMSRHGDSRTKIWVTEVGWATAGGNKAFSTSQRGQAARVGRTLRALVRARQRYRIEAVTWFAFRDRALHDGERNWWAPHAGLFDVHGEAKPAWATFRQIVADG